MAYKRINVFVYGAFIAIILFGAVFFISRYRHFRDQERRLIPIQFLGRIDSMRDLTHGTYFIRVQSKDSAIKLQSLMLGYDVDRTKLRIGDSVSKDRLSRKISFYRGESGKRTHLFDYLITD